MKPKYIYIYIYIFFVFWNAWTALMVKSRMRMINAGQRAYRSRHGVFLKLRPKSEDLRPKTPWAKTKSPWTKTKTPWTKTKTPWTKTKPLGLKRRPRGLKRRPLGLKRRPHGLKLNDYLLTAEGNARSRNLSRRFGKVVKFPQQYLVVIIKSITYLPSGFFEHLLHVLKHFGTVHCDDDVSFISIKAFCRVNLKVREPSWP